MTRPNSKINIDGESSYFEYKANPYTEIYATKTAKINQNSKILTCSFATFCHWLILQYLPILFLKDLNSFFGIVTRLKIFCIKLLTKTRLQNSFANARWPIYGAVRDPKVSHFFKQKTLEKWDTLGTFTQKVPFLDYNKTQQKEKSRTLLGETLWGHGLYEIS